MRNRLMFAMEEVQEEVLDNVEEKQEELETESEEMQSDAEVIEEIQETIEEGGDAAETLDQIAEIVEEAAESDEPVSEDAVKIATVAVESIMNNLGFSQKKIKSVFPAMEAFQGAQTNKAAAMVAVEGIKERVAEIWKTLQKFIMETFEKIKAFLARFVTATGRVREFVKLAQKKAAATAKDAAPKEAELKLKSVYKGFYDSTSGKTDLGKIVQNQEILTNNFIQTVDVINGSVKAIEEYIKSPTTETDAAVNEAIVKMNSEIGAGLPTISTNNFGPFLGGKVLSLSLVKDTGKMVVAFEDNPAGKEDGTVKALSLDECNAVLKTVDELMTATDKYKASQSKLDSIQKAINSAIATAIKINNLKGSDKKADDKEGPTAGPDKARAMISALSTSYSKLITAIPNMNIGAAKLGLAYVNASLANLQAPKAE